MIPQRFGRIINTDIFLAEGPSAAEGMGITLDQLIELFTAESAIKRTNTVEEVASVALLLATDMAGGITGALYSIDGGTDLPSGQRRPPWRPAQPQLSAASRRR